MFSYSREDFLRKNGSPSNVPKKLNGTKNVKREIYRREDRLAVLQEFQRYNHLRRRINVSPYGSDIMMPIGFGKRR